MTEYTIEYSPVARIDLKGIFSYIAFHLKERTTARNIINRIRKGIKDLDVSPDRYPPVEWEPWSSMGMRRFSVGNYEIFYLVNHDKTIVTVIRIFYGGRNIQNMINTNKD